MKHFTAEDEIDFANEVLPATRKRTLEEHLKGCKRCTNAVSQWRQVQKSAAADANYQPPPEALRIAKAAFAGLQLALRGETDSSIEVVFDSLLQTSVEGFRSAGGGATRHVLYRADPFQIDLQVELQPGDKRVVVTGQLLGSRDPQIAGRDVTLILANMRGRVVRAVTNQFGEFRAEIENSGDLALVFYQADQKPLVISLRDALGPASDKERKHSE
jgi:predicted anti-sigma-YlaC factor YlaD